MLRIAFIVHTFQAGGLERCVARLASRLDRARFRPVIICLDRSGSAVVWLECSDVPVFELNKRPGHDIGLVVRFARLLRAEGIHLVHSHNWGSLLETVLARFMGSVPFHIHAERGLELAELRANIWRRNARDLVGRVALSRTDAVVAVSQEIRNGLLLSGVPARRIHLIHNGIDPLPVTAPALDRARLREELGIDALAVLVCSVARLVPVKDLATTVESIALLVREGSNIHVALVGDGPERDRIRLLAQTAGVAGRVHLVGERADVGAWLAAADIYVNSSLYEGMSQAVLEAMAAGLPLAVTDVGENATLVGRGDASCGRIVPPANVPALASALGELSMDRELRARLGQHARERQRGEFSLSTMVQRYEHLYARIAGATKSDVVAPIDARRR